MPLNRHLFLFSLAVAASGVIAAWEDTGVVTRTPTAPTPAATVQTLPRQTSPGQRHYPTTPSTTYRQPAPQYRAPAVRQEPQPIQPQPTPHMAPYGLTPPDLYSPFLDASLEPLKWFSLLYAVPATVGDSAKDLTIVEVEGRYNLVQWRNVLGGDIDLDLRLRTIIFPSDANYEPMPTALLELPLAAEWRWRFLNGFSFEIGARPGIFADIESPGDGFAVPFKGALYYAATPELSWLLGVEVRPGWDLVALPLAGLAWEPSDFMHLTLACPSSTALFRFGPIGLYGTVAWRNTTFGLSGKDDEPDKMTVADISAGAGLAINFSDSFRLKVEGGYLFNRSLILENSNDDDKLKIDDTPYLRLAFGGSF